VTLARRELFPLRMMQIISDLDQKELVPTWIHRYRELFGRSFRTTMAICGLGETSMDAGDSCRQADAGLLHVRCGAMWCYKHASRS
jgi:hypothetical protein